MVASYKLDRAAELEARAEKMEARARDLRQKAKLLRNDKAPTAAAKPAGSEATARAAWRGMARLPMSLGLVRPVTRAAASSASPQRPNKPDGRRSSHGTGSGPQPEEYVVERRASFGEVPQIAQRARDNLTAFAKRHASRAPHKSEFEL